MSESSFGQYDESPEHVATPADAAPGEEPVEEPAESPAEEPGPGPRPGFEPTGNPTVDSVLESLDRLDNAPVAEHVEVFESAHERLRSALADAGNDEQRP